MAEKNELFIVRGLVLRTTDVGERNRMLTVLSGEEGKLSVYARGVKTLTSISLPSAQLFAYADFTLVHGRDRWMLREGFVQETFMDLTASVEDTALAAYLCEVAEELSFPGGEAHDLLQLTLNALWTLSARKKPRAIVKAAYEFRAAAIGGYCPDVGMCCACGKETFDEDVMLDVMNGRIFCRDCHKTYFGDLPDQTPDGRPLTDDTGTAILFRRLTPAALEALRYVIYTPAKRQFSFSVEGEDLRLLCEAAETYLTSHVGHGYRTLSYYHSLADFRV